jgi:NADPH:quinone reductase
MIIKLAKHDGIRTINVVRRHASVAELERLGADAVIVSTEGPIDEQVRRIVGPQGVKYAIDPVVGETGTQMYQALGEEGRMLVYGSLTGEPIRVGADPRLILAGRRILEVFWLGYWFSKLDETVRTDLVQEIVTLSARWHSGDLYCRAHILTRRDSRGRHTSRINRQAGKGTSCT